MTMHDSVGERALIAALKRRVLDTLPRGGAIRIGIGDDCAVLRPPPGHEIVVTTDLFLENVHFRRDWHTPESAGHRCLARGLSDLAAMGAAPLAAFLSVALPPELAIRARGTRSCRISSPVSSSVWFSRFLDGFLALAKQAKVPLAGGDTAQAPPFPLPQGLVKPLTGAPSSFFAADIVLLGSVPAGHALLRSGARAGDRIYVTGRLGGAAAELQRLAENHPARLRRLRAPLPGVHHPHLFPEPRLAAARRLRPLASAAIDLSDGIATDLDHLCQASRLCAVLQADRLPIHPLAQAHPSAQALALSGGEDYELLFTAPASTHIPRSIAGVPAYPIGHMRKPAKGEFPSVLLRTDEVETIVSKKGWEHFQAALDQ
jgi:thiamine-monophosphate kinase